tara:strand:- start:288 stop:542 length:255 start_codon:yes stop_codon:yes gene_type:complete
MTITETVEEVTAFLEAETTVTLLTDEPSKFMVALKNLLEDVSSAADDVDSAIQSAIDACEEVRSRAEDTASEAENAISELEYMR